MKVQGRLLRETVVRGTREDGGGEYKYIVL
jgi:hypothetical protein